MRKSTAIRLVLPLAAMFCLVAFEYLVVTARQSISAQEVTKAAPAIERDESGGVTVKLPRGAKVTVGNRTTGRITVIGWDQDTVEARAISERGVEYVRTRLGTDPSGISVSLKADYAGEGLLMDRLEEVKARILVSDGRKKSVSEQRRDDRKDGGDGRGDGSAAAPSDPPSGQVAPGDSGSSPPPAFPGPLQITSVPPMNRTAARPSSIVYRPREIHLEVKVPRYAEIELIEVYRSDVEVRDVGTHVAVSGGKSTIKINNVGSTEVRTKSGAVDVEEVSGLVDLITASGPIRVRKTGSDVRAISISGDVEIRCARGRVNVGNTEGSIRLLSNEGDIDATTTGSDIRFTGAIRKEGRYHLKSMSGSVEMSLSSTPAGFTAELSSYRGTVEAAFAMKIIKSTTNEPTDRRLVGRYGNGQARVTLDSFDGNVKLSKAASAATEDCR